MPSAFQISAMATHMLVASPVLTLVSAMVSEDYVENFVFFLVSFEYMKFLVFVSR